MMKSKSFWTAAALCAAASAGGAQAATEGPLEAPAQRSHCLAVAHRFNGLNASFGAKIVQFNQVFPSPDENQTQILAGIKKLQTSTRQIADALTSVYGDAPTPAATDEASVATRSVQELIPDVKTCLG